MHLSFSASGSLFARLGPALSYYPADIHPVI
jgi:hypothetical protein